MNGDLFIPECGPSSLCEEVVDDVNSGVYLAEELGDEVVNDGDDINNV